MTSVAATAASQVTLHCSCNKCSNITSSSSCVVEIISVHLNVSPQNEATSRVFTNTDPNQPNDVTPTLRETQTELVSFL
jgi:hypothetical protein